MLPDCADNGSNWARFWNFPCIRPGSLQFGFGRRQFARGNNVVESDSIVRSITERLIGGLAATAERNHSTSGESERGAVRVQDFEIAFDTDRAVAGNGDFRGHLPTVAQRYFFFGGVVPVAGGVVGGPCDFPSSTTSPNLIVDLPSYFL